MAAVEQPTSSINGDIKFSIGTDDSGDDMFEAATLQDEVIVHLLAPNDGNRL